MTNFNYFSVRQPDTEEKKKARQEARRILSRRNPREKVECPVCGKTAERSRNGDWKCRDTTNIGMGAFRMSVLTCNASGVTLGDELVIISRPMKEASNEGSSLQDAS